MFKKIFLNIAIVVSVLLSNLSYSQQTKIQEAEEKEFFLQEIEVKEGQTLSYIANYYLKDPKQWPEILKYNKLSTSDIYAPLPGMKLKVPILIVKEKFRPAYLIYILNNVKYRKRNTVSWEEPQINMELYNDDAITTYENSRANIKFYSGEILSIDENSFVTIRPELKQEEVRLHKGGVRATKAKVITETAEVVPKIDPKLPKTDFRTKFRAEDKTTLVEVYDGAVNVTAEGKTIYVPKGFGTEVKLLSPPSTPKPLPPPPEIAFKTESVKFTSDNELVLSKSLPNVSFQLQEPKIETLPFVADTKQNEKQKLTPQPLDYSKPKILGNIIKKYHIQIAKDIEFKKVVYDEVGDIRPDKTINFDISKLQLSDGRYYYKISYIDELGFENPATPRVFIVDTTPPKLEIDPSLGTKTDKDVIHITGRTEPDSILIANNKKVDVDKDGNFTFAEVLKLGINKIQLVAK
ncbi:MAG: FecR domain-containing protein, partial [Endomicrobia bacterium]|nr:FecR domain-containing protein [Endomicrobiia bacterium]